MDQRRLGRSELSIAPLVLGTNVMGWTADERTSFAVLDAFIDHGFNAVDTADVYSRWVKGNDSESERIIGRWLRERRNRDKVVLMTKVGSDLGEDRKGLSAAYVAQAVDASLRRLQTDYIDLYQSHWPDPAISHEETLEAYGKLIKAGKVRVVGASNYDEDLLNGAIKAGADNPELPRYETVQNEFNLYTRDKMQGAVQDLVIREGMSAITYYGLASGFLSGKYRTEADLKRSVRGEGSIPKYMNEKGFSVLTALDTVGERIGAAPAEIALAWVAAQPGIAAPIASATSRTQLESLVRGARLALDAESLALLDAAGQAPTS